MNSTNIGNTSCICSANSQLLGSSELNSQQPIQPPRTPATSGSEANYLADSLGVSPLYRQQDSHRWQSAAKIYQSSRSQAHSPATTGAPLNFTTFGDSLSSEGTLSQKIRQCRSIGSPILLEDIATLNRQLHFEVERGQRRVASMHGSLELEALAAVHELATHVKQISVSEILPRTADLIFVNIKTYKDQPYTLELTMKGWRICSSHSDCMNGDYHNIALHTRYFQNAKEVLDVISPEHDKHFNESYLNTLHDSFCKTLLFPFQRVVLIFHFELGRFGDGDVGASSRVNLISKDMEAQQLTSIATVSSVGFRLVDKSFLFGPIAVFPKTTLSWRVLSPSDITPESLELFFMLQPKLDILLIGAGNKSDIDIVRRNVGPAISKARIGFEILDSEDAATTFNFLNFEGRCVAAALFPPRDYYVNDKEHLAFIRDVRGGLDGATFDEVTFGVGSLLDSLTAGEDRHVRAACYNIWGFRTAKAEEMVQVIHKMRENLKQKSDALLDEKRKERSKVPLVEPGDDSSTKSKKE
uniref:GSKIP domain-containing protein n=1 Tax=Meloidogyne javanica TaxID=6303 RepID=A0A915M3Y6_MELJA